MSEFTIRPVTAQEYPAFVTALIEGFSDDVPDESFVENIRHTLPPERTLAAFDGEAIVGTFGGYDLTLTVPGGAVPMEGTTVVTVFPTHRRRGLMQEMMRVHLDNAAANGYPVAGLWASDSSIYTRFGYGAATYGQTVNFDGTQVGLRNGVPLDRLRRVTKDEASGVLPRIFDRICPTTPGMFSRDATWWDVEILTDEDWMKRGRTSHRIVVHDGPDGPDGYIIYRQKQSESDDGHADGTVHVVEMAAATARARASLWAYLFDVDGCPNVRIWNMATDDPIRMMVGEPRRIRVTAQFDALWVRILDVPSALEGRMYESDGSVVLGITDEFRPSTGGTYRLEIERGAATCTRIDGTPEVEMGIDVLGALYLGGGDAPGYADAGRIRGATAAIGVLRRMLRTSRAPWCNQVF
ncbi:MAG: GNAT family N-acetyltransferase [Actinomycetia bacterium]|nr:GNAT family N-acetyltransferase [Actinomycetes bacterium]